MIYLLSPAKGMDTSGLRDGEGKTPSSKTARLDSTKHAYTPAFSALASYYEMVARRLSTLSLLECADAFGIKGALLERSYADAQSYASLGLKEAFSLYNGTAYKEIAPLDSMSKDELAFVSEHIIILSALYGALRPTTLIHPYRLDLSVRLFSHDTLARLLQKELGGALAPYKDELFINLASREFSALIDRREFSVIDVEFYKHGSIASPKRCASTEAKRARGRAIDAIIKAKANSLEALEALKIEGFSYVSALSSDKTLAFMLDGN